MKVYEEPCSNLVSEDEELSEKEDELNDFTNESWICLQSTNATNSTSTSPVLGDKPNSMNQSDKKGEFSN